MATTTQFSTRVPADLYDWLKDTAEARCVSIQFLITKAVERLRDSMPEVPA